jgi:hypothetical protein
MKTIIAFLICFLLAQPCRAQDIELRRWSHLPLGSNFGSVAYAHTEGDVFFINGKKLEENPLLFAQHHLIYPDVINMMEDDLDWTESLGTAFTTQQADVHLKSR